MPHATGLVLLACAVLGYALPEDKPEIAGALGMALVQTMQSGAPPLLVTTTNTFYLRGMEFLQLVPCSVCPTGSQVLEACSVVSDTVCDFSGCSGIEFNPSASRRKSSSVFGNAVSGLDCNMPLLDSEGGWCASQANNVPNEWTQIDLGYPMPVAHVITQARKTAPEQRITKFKIMYGDSESSLQFLENGRVFDGNLASDATQKVINKFDRVVLARYWRIVPTVVNSFTSARWGLGVCPSPASCVPTVLNPDNSKRRYSSFFTADPYRTAVLDGTQGWLAQTPNNVPNDWTLIELTVPERIGAVIIQPRKDAPQHRVVKFRVQYSNDDQVYRDVDDGRVFDGNQFDRDEKIWAEFNNGPILAKYWKLIPTQISGHLGMRWALGKCVG